MLKTKRKDSIYSQNSAQGKVSPLMEATESQTLEDDFKDVELNLIQNFGRAYYKYHGPKDEKVHRLLEDLDENVKPGLRVWEFIKNTNRRMNHWFTEMDCCHDHNGPISFSKDTFFLVVVCLVVILYIAVNFRVTWYIFSNVRMERVREIWLESCCITLR
jgi:hypothetical protein